MTSTAFSLQLNNAYWLDDDDLCAHGDITLLVKGVNIVEGATNGWNLNWSSVRLLTSVFQDIPTSDHNMIACGCTIGSLCGSDICFAVHHHDGHVSLSDFENRNVEGGMEQFKGLAITLPWRDYVEQVYAFAVGALSLITGSRGHGDSEEDRSYRALRTEHVNLLFQLKERLHGNNIISLYGLNEAPLFNFHLRPIEDVSPFGYENQLSLHWYGLTEGWYWLRVGDAELLRFSDALEEKWKADGEPWEHPCVEYYVVRLWEDMQDILPSVLEPIPEAVRRRCDPGQQGWQLLARDEACLEQHDDWDTWITATGWLSDRQLDAGYLVQPPRIRFWTDGTTLHITWDNRDRQEEGIPIWSTQHGQVTMPLAQFIDEVRSFDERLIAAMAERVESARAHWPLPDVEIDLDYLEVEHRDRATWMDQAFARAQMQHTDWDAVITAMDVIEVTGGTSE